jgi:hypothetical protein
MQAIAMARDFVQLHVDHWPGWEGSVGGAADHGPARRLSPESSTTVEAAVALAPGGDALVDRPVTRPHDVAVATWREQSARLVGGLLRLTATSGSPRTARTTPCSPRSSSGRRQASRTSPGPG